MKTSNSLTLSTEWFSIYFLLRDSEMHSRYQMHDNYQCYMHTGEACRLNIHEFQNSKFLWNERFEAEFSVFISHVIKTKNRNRSINKFKNLGYDR